MEQIKGVMGNKATVDTAQQKLLTELNDVKASITDFDEEKAAIKVQ